MKPLFLLVITLQFSLLYKYSDGQNWLTSGNIVGGVDFIGSTNAANLNFRTFNTQRMTIKGINNMNPFTDNLGWVGIGNDMPMSKLHIGESNCYSGQTCANGTLAGGWRDWMETGVFMCENTDNMYVGLKHESSDHNDAVISWGDGLGGNPSFGPDNLRFIFAEYCIESPNDPVATGPNGLEVMRITPPGLTGIGTSFFTSGIQPARRLEIHDPNAPQLRLSFSLGATSLFTDFQMINTGQSHLLILPRNNSIGNPESAKVGIGALFQTNSPQAKLDINANYNQLRLTRNNGVNFANFYCNTQGELEITTDAVNRIGIGGDPANNLDVYGGARIQSMPVDNTLSNVVVANATGDLSINTTLLSPLSSGWLINGNSNINSLTNFLGTTNAVDVVFRTNNTEKMRIIGNPNIPFGVFEGSVGIGTGSPTARLNVEYFYTQNVTPSVISYFRFRNLSNSLPGITFVAVKGSADITTAAGSQTNIGGDFSAEGGVFNYGVKGTTTGASSQSSTHYAVYGTSGNAPFWAGYFNGAVFSSGGYFPSDSSMKKNVTSIVDALSLVNKLKAKTYNYIDDPNCALNLPKEKQYGFIAQDMEAIFPELVASITQPEVTDTAGNILKESFTFKGINYTSLIPLIISALQQQDSVIQVLQSAIMECCNNGMRSVNSENDGTQNTISKESVELNDYLVLGQNVPNPFAEKTVISFFVPDGYSKAEIIFYDNNGRMINSKLIITRGAGELTVYADNLSDGLYSYSLIADGKLIDTKKMVKQH